MGIIFAINGTDMYYSPHFMLVPYVNSVFVALVRNSGSSFSLLFVRLSCATGGSAVGYILLKRLFAKLSVNMFPM